MTVNTPLAQTRKDDPHALEIVTFRLAPGAEEAAFLAAASGTEAMLRARGTLLRRTLSRGDDGLWTDIVEWSSIAAAREAAGAVPSDPEFAPFAAMIDGATVEMRHASVIWRMD